MVKITNEDLLEFAEYCYQVMQEGNYMIGTGNSNWFFVILTETRELWVFQYRLFNQNKVIEKYAHQISQIMSLSKDENEIFYLWDHENKPYSSITYPLIRLSELPVNWREKVQFKKDYFPIGMFSAKRC